MGATSKPQGQAMYVANPLDKSWLLSEQRKLHKRSLENPDYIFCKLWGLVTDPRNLRTAFERVARNKGRRTAGVDGLTVKAVLRKGVEAFIEQVRGEMRSGKYRPSPVRRVLIPKPGQPGRFRPLGIPTVKDRVVQAAVKNILEPIFEGDFYPSSYGFRPGRSVHGALEHLRLLLRPTVKPGGAKTERGLPYQWAIEGDIKGCFDNIDHHGLMNRIRRRVDDAKVNRLVVAFLKAGVLSEQQFTRTENGTPQGGILSPLLANVALSAIEERHERYVWPRRTPTLLTEAAAIGKRATRARTFDRPRRPMLFPIRYADDFIILVSVPPGPLQSEGAQEVALQEKAALSKFLWENLHLELSEAKTLVTPVTKPLRFLGHHVRVHVHPTRRWLASAVVIPRDRSQRIRELIKDLFRSSTVQSSLKQRLQLLNPLLRGWGNFYRHARGAKAVFSALDEYVWRTILRWLLKKHRPAFMKNLRKRYSWRKPGGRSYGWRDGGAMPYRLSRLRVDHFWFGWMRTPDFV